MHLNPSALYPQHRVYWGRRPYTVVIQLLEGTDAFCWAFVGPAHSSWCTQTAAALFWWADSHLLALKHTALNYIPFSARKLRVCCVAQTRHVTWPPCPRSSWSSTVFRKSQRIFFFFFKYRIRDLP